MAVSANQIQWLINAGYQVLKVMNAEIKGQVDWSVFIVLRFDPAEKDEPFHNIRGIDITDFVNLNRTITTEAEYVEKLMQLIESKVITDVNVRFSVNTISYVYSKN
jgi:hypothetical protein